MGCLDFNVNQDLASRFLRESGLGMKYAVTKMKNAISFLFCYYINEHMNLMPRFQCES